MSLKPHQFLDMETEQTLNAKLKSRLAPGLAQRIGHVHSKAVIFFICVSIFKDLLVNYTDL